MLETPNIIFAIYLEIDNILNFTRLLPFKINSGICICKEKKNENNIKNFYWPKYFLLIFLPSN